MIINKEKQMKGVIQNEKVLLYKPYDILSESSKPTTPELILLQEEIINLEKVLKILQVLMKAILFLPPAHYKTIQQGRERNIQY